MTKSFLGTALTACVCGLLSAQQPEPPPQAQTPADNGGVPVTLMQPSERANYVNFFAFLNGIYDSASALPGVTTGPSSGTAIEGGGGLTANHDFATGTFSLGYHVDYRTHADPQYPAGTDQSLNFLFRKLLTRRATFSIQENAGIYPVGTSFLQPTSTTEQNVLQTTPFSLRTEFAGTTLALAYQQTLRLSYEFTGTYSLLRYNSPVSFGNEDIGGSASALYRITRATTLSGTYQYSAFLYQHDAGTTSANTAYLTLSHNFARHWTVGASGGATFSSSTGTTEVSVDFEIGTVLIPIFLPVRYTEKSTLPYAQGTLSHNWRHTVLSLNGGESVTPGNGFFLASRNLGVSGVLSYSMPRFNISAAGYYSRLTSVAYASSAKVNTADLQLSYAYNLTRYLGVNLRYDHIDYGNVGMYSARSDNRVTLGLYFTSKGVPLAVF